MLAAVHSKECQACLHHVQDCTARSGRKDLQGSADAVLQRFAPRPLTLTNPLAGMMYGTSLQDVREYILDALGHYASLQRFDPAPSADAKLITAESLLRHFLFEDDKAAVLAAHPWLRCALERGV